MIHNTQRERVAEAVANVIYPGLPWDRIKEAPHLGFVKKCVYETTDAAIAAVMLEILPQPSRMSA